MSLQLKQQYYLKADPKKVFELYSSTFPNQYKVIEEVDFDSENRDANYQKVYDSDAHKIYLQEDVVVLPISDRRFEIDCPSVQEFSEKLQCLAIEFDIYEGYSANLIVYENGQLIVSLDINLNEEEGNDAYEMLIYNETFREIKDKLSDLLEKLDEAKDDEDLYMDIRDEIDGLIGDGYFIFQHYGKNPYKLIDPEKETIEKCILFESHQKQEAPTPQQPLSFNSNGFLNSDLLR